MPPPPGKRSPIISELISIKGESITRVSKTKFLGVIIDDKLSWVDHIQYAKNKISKGIGIICKARKLLNRKTLLTLYYCFVYPYITYAIEVWGDSCITYINSLVTVQKKVLRLISFSQWRSHS